MRATALCDGQYRAQEKGTTLNMALAPIIWVTLGKLFVSLSLLFLQGLFGGLIGLISEECLNYKPCLTHSKCSKT